jgi:hypothetical protein
MDEENGENTACGCHFLRQFDVLYKWRVESKVPIMEEALAWLEEEQQQEEQEEEEEEEEHLEDIMEVDVLASTPPSTQIDAPSSTPIIHLQTFGVGPEPSIVKGKPSKQPMTFSRKRRGH